MLSYSPPLDCQILHSQINVHPIKAIKQFFLKTQTHLIDCKVIYSSVQMIKVSHLSMGTPIMQHLMCIQCTARFYYCRPCIRLTRIPADIVVQTEIRVRRAWKCTECWRFCQRRKVASSETFNGSERHWLEFTLIYIIPISTQSKWSKANFCWEDSAASRRRLRIPPPQMRNVYCSVQVRSQANHRRWRLLCEGFCPTCWMQDLGHEGIGGLGWRREGGKEGRRPEEAERAPSCLPCSSLSSVVQLLSVLAWLPWQSAL